MIDLKSLTKQELGELLAKHDEPKYRTDQVLSQIYSGCTSIDAMSTLPKSLKEKLKTSAVLSKAKIIQKLVSQIDETKKYLIELDDDNTVETVLMQYAHGNSICISTQVGCRMGCRFCASTIGGLVRNLTAGEMIGQILSVSLEERQRISNVVIMGMGEPFDNFEELKKFLLLVHEKWGLGIGYRHITVSTCGIVPKIKELQTLGLPINLAISLHASTQEERKQLMPISNRYPLEEVVQAAKEYSNHTKRRVTYEYALMKGVNDSPRHAMQLAKLLRGSLSHINVIPVNAVGNSGFKRPGKRETHHFVEELKKHHIAATVRRELGQDIDGACGQLRRRIEQDELK